MLMSTWTIIPVKPLHESKRRLAHLLTPDDRASLIYGFLENLLAVLGQAPSIDHILVVTADPAVATLARDRGASVLVEAAPSGLNDAVNRGVDTAMGEGATAVLVLPVDLPFIRIEDVEQLVAALAGVNQPAVVICGDETEDGTNALLLSPPGNFTFRYGPASFRAHLAEARERDRRPLIEQPPGLRFDLDTESDWLVYNGYLVQVADE